jgi:hypothetical protein
MPRLTRKKAAAAPKAAKPKTTEIDFSKLSPAERAAAKQQLENDRVTQTPKES